MIQAMPAEFNAFEAAMSAALDRWSLPVEPEQMRKLRAHFEAVIEANRTMNLTRITDPVEAAVKHYADSFGLLPWVRDRRITVHTVLDVGTGAGFPAVPLAVMRPDWLITALDSTGKKIAFLRRTADALGLSNLQCEHAHSLHWRPGGKFDLVVSRATAKLPKTLQDVTRHLEDKGWLVAYKTASIESTELEAANAVALNLRLHAQEPYVYELTTHGETLRRLLLIYRRAR